MKKCIVICIVLLMITVLISCNKPSINRSNKFLVSDSSISALQQTPIVDNNLPLIKPYMINTINEMIEWIKTVDEKNYQNGNFNKFITQIKSDGSILIPTYNGDIVNFRNDNNFKNIQIWPQYQYEDNGYGFGAIMDDLYCTICIYYLDEKVAENTNGSIDKYKKEKYGVNKMITENEIVYSKKIKKDNFFIDAKITENKKTNANKIEYIMHNYYILINTPSKFDVNKIEKISFKEIKLE